MTKRYQTESFLQEEIDQAFTHHPPSPDQVERYQQIRAKGKEFAELITRLCPGSDELDFAFVRVREAVMYANAAIACNEPTVAPSQLGDA